MHRTIHYYSIIIFLVFLTLVSCAKKKSCDPENEEQCPSGSICKKVGTDEGMCLDVCEQNVADSCSASEVCIRYADNTYACTPNCDPESTNECPDDWLCAPVASSEHVCRPECDLDSDTCDEGEVCQPLSDETAVCTPECDPLGESDCGENWVCELRTDGSYSCYEPVYFKGKVLDSSTEDPIEGAHVIAVDKTGAAATDVAVTDADGIYELQVPVVREPDGTPYEGIYTLRISASDYLPYPHGIRPAIPIEASLASYLEEGQWVLENASTEITLIAMPAEKQGQGSISGSIVVNSGDTSPGGVLVVVEGDTEEAPFSFGDKSGHYTVFNVPEGSWEVHGYKAFLQLDPVTVTSTTGEVKTGIDLISNSSSCGTVKGSLNIVNAPGGSMTSVVICPESTFNEDFVKGEVPPGLRAPAPPESPSITDSFTIEGVPDGRYVVLAAFENDSLVRDPDPSIAGTQILHIQVPDDSSYDIDIASSFKVTEALVIVSPGAIEPELITETPTFTWKDDSSETRYSIVVYNAFGDEVWRDNNLPRVTGSEDVAVNYDGDPLQTGMYYQFRVTSWKSGGPISQTEDLLGVFYTSAD